MLWYNGFSMRHGVHVGSYKRVANHDSFDFVSYRIASHWTRESGSIMDCEFALPVYVVIGGRIWRF